jgi:hypothetical protein
MTTRRNFFMAASALAVTFASVGQTPAQAAEEPPNQADFLFVQTAKGMTFDDKPGDYSACDAICVQPVGDEEASLKGLAL